MSLSSEELKDPEEYTMGLQDEATSGGGGFRQPRPRAPDDISRDTATFSDFFCVNPDIGKSTQEILVSYNEDGEGIFSKNEVVKIVTDLQQPFRKNRVGDCACVVLCQF
jgi:hypothetical protein